jgi:hypothetical protein
MRGLETSEGFCSATGAFVGIAEVVGPVAVLPSELMWPFCGVQQLLFKRLCSLNGLRTTSDVHITLPQCLIRHAFLRAW